jgi:hypothetical protein
MFVIERTSITSVTLAERLGCSLPREQQLLVHLHVVATGWSHHAHPAPIITEVLADPALSPMRRDLRTELRHAVAALVEAATASGAG